jgi:hypothetical protein
MLKNQGLAEYAEVSGNKNNLALPRRYYIKIA